MDEQEWLKCDDVQAMLDFMWERISYRKENLYTTGSYRIVWHLLSDVFRNLNDAIEDYVDGLATEVERNAAIDAATGAPNSIRLDAWRAIPPQGQVQLVRDLFGNPFRPAQLDPSWLTWSDGAIPKLARSIYSERGFDRLPWLADLLQKAGCTNTDILAHCGEPGEHWKGCWLIDLLLNNC